MSFKLDQIVAGNLRGSQGTTGQSIQGSQGTTGATGSFGGATFKYKYSTDTTITDPASGYIEFNSLTLSSATDCYINFIDANGDNIYNFLNTIDDSTSSVKGHFKIQQESDPANFAMFAITGNHTEEGSPSHNHFHIPVTFLPGPSYSFAGDMSLVITFARTGDKGDNGLQGVQGLQGTQGTQGLQGTQGVQGTQGTQGTQGLQGTQGVQGTQGIQGTQGTQGTTGVSPGGSTGNVAKFTGATTLDNSRLYDDGGNISIGTTTASANLHVSTLSSDSVSRQEIVRLSRTGGIAGAGYLAGRSALLSFSDSLNFTLTAAIGGIRNGSGNDYNGSLAFYTSNTLSTSATTVSQLTEAMRIDNYGNVGIGTSSPTNIGTYTTVEVKGKIGTSGGVFKTKSYDGVISGEYYTSNWAGAGVYLIASTNHPLIFGTNDTENMRLTTAGKLGIGTTLPDEALHVVGKIKASSGILTRSDASTASTSTLSWNSNNYDIFCITAQTTGLTINADSGSPTNGQRMIFRIKTYSGAGSFSMTTGAASKTFRYINITPPPNLTNGNTLYIGCIYNSADDKWDVIALREGS